MPAANHCEWTPHLSYVSFSTWHQSVVGHFKNLYNGASYRKGRYFCKLRGMLKVTEKPHFYLKMGL